MNIHEAPPGPAPLPCVEGAHGGCQWWVLAPGWILALHRDRKLLSALPACTALGISCAIPWRSRAQDTRGCPQLAGRGQAPLGAWGCGDVLGGTGAMGSPPLLPGAEQEAEQVVFPRREKAAYVPGSPACGGGGDAATPPVLRGRTQGPRGASGALQEQHSSAAARIPAPWGILHEPLAPS